MERFIFLDKDGTLVPDVPYNVDPDRIFFTPGTAIGLRRLAEAGFHFVIVSNQSGVARGYFKGEDLQVVEARMRVLFEQEAGAKLDGFYFCPHHPEGTVAKYAVECDCRKPRPGMLLQAARDLNIDLADAWMIGDILNDIEAGKRAGCRTILINNGNETEWQKGLWRTPDFVVSDLEEAAHIILSQPTNQVAINRREG